MTDSTAASTSTTNDDDENHPTNNHDDDEDDDDDIHNNKNDDSNEIKAKKNVFIRSEEHAWLPARILEQTADTAVVQVFDIDGGGDATANTTTKSSTTTRQVTVDLAEYPPQNALPLKNVNEYGDMIDLPFLHEPGILYNLRRRFMNDRPYTRTGDILIAVNPYRWLSDVYTTERRRRYMPGSVYDAASGMAVKSLDPHVYEISALAFRGLAVDDARRNQSILVSGESGAGKTETVKICLDHIATIQGGLKRPGRLSSSDDDAERGQRHQVMSDIVQRVVDSNPLLEAFGNAKTVRNDNSSRFGKFVQLQFDRNDVNDGNSGGAVADTSSSSSYGCDLVGSHIEVYLLEKSRVVSHAPGERNFHIFYQLLAASDNVKKKIGVDGVLGGGKSPASFPYLGSRNSGMKVRRRSSFAGQQGNGKNKNGNTEPLIESMSDVQWFEQTIRELEIIGIRDETLWMLMRALAAVLQLGTIQFVADDADNATLASSQMARGGEFVKLADLMGIDVETLRTAFTNKTIMAGTTEISSPLSPQQAKEGCDAYAKDLYSKIFLWLVGTINAATSASPRHNNNHNDAAAAAGDAAEPEHGTIGVLDIFGFEAFKTNHFEQLCINYANERLQYMFASNVFVSLIDEYAREGLVVDFSYETNTNVLDLIAGRTGVLATLNEECIRPGGSDEEFVYKALNQNKNSPRMFKTDLFTRYQFGIKHFAGPVVYTAKDFLSTNKDIMPIDLQKVSRSSTNTIIAVEIAAAGGGGGSVRSRSNMVKNTVISKFRTQLNSLMKTLSNTQTRYIRCIKPNSTKQPGVMENTEIMRQLSSGGVIAAIKIASASYPNKMDHHAVLKRFRNLGDKPDPTQDVETQVSELLAEALKDFVSPIKGGTPRPPTTLGKTKTYFRTGALEYLENARNENIGFFAIIIQRSYRMAPLRRSFLKQRKAAVMIQAIMRACVWKKRVERMPACALTIQCWSRRMIAKRRLNEHKSAVKIQRRWCTAREVIRLEYRTRAAIEIQKIARGSLQRPRFRQELTEKTNAAVRVQSIVRGYLQLVKFRKELAAKTQAAIHMQRAVRGSTQRIKFKIALERNKSAVQLQRSARGYVQRGKFKIALAKLRAAIHLQRSARGYNQRGRFKILLEQELARNTQAAVHIQRIVRGYLQLLKYGAMLKAEKERMAAVNMQRIGRGHIQLMRYLAIKTAEEERIAAEKAAEEARLKAEQLAEAEEEERLAAEKAAEETRLRAEKLAEEKRIAAEKREAERIAAVKRAEEERQRLEAEKKAEEERRRLEAERHAEEKRIAAEKRAEEERLEAERRAEEERQRLEAQRIAEEERIAAEKRAEEERLEAERRAEEERLAAEKRAEEERMETERVAAEKRAEKERLEAERAAVEKRAEEERVEAERVAAERAALEERLAAAERRAEEERVKAEKLATENAALEDRISTANSSDQLDSEENAALERAIQSAQEKAAADNAMKEEPDTDGELEVALEMALLAGQNPDLPPGELNKLLGKPTLNGDSSTGGFLWRMVGNPLMAAAKSLSTTPPGVVVAAPWTNTEAPSLGQFLASSGGMSRAASRDDDTFAESVVSSMMLPDSLTAEQLRSRRQDLKMNQELRKVKKKISEKSRELRKLRSRGDKARAGNRQKQNALVERQEEAYTAWEDRLQKLPYDDRDTELFTEELEKAAVDLGLQDLDAQIGHMSEEEQLQMEVQSLQESQLVRQMLQMRVTGHQKFLRKKHIEREIEYIKSCETWLSDYTNMNMALQKMESLIEEMKILYESTLRRQEAAFARHDADMTIRETIEDLF